MKKILTTFALLGFGAFAATAQTQNCDLELKLTSHTNGQEVPVSCDDNLSVSVEVTNNGPDYLDVDSPLSMALIAPYDSAWYGTSSNTIRMLTTFRPDSIAPAATAATTTYSGVVRDMYILYDYPAGTFTDFYASNPVSGDYIAEFAIRGIGAPGSSGFWEETGLVVDADSTNDAQYIVLKITCEVGVKEINANTSKLNVYPNPTNNGTASFDFEFTANETATVRVFDVTGRTVLTQEVKGTGLETVKLDVSSLNAGMYNLEIATADRRGVSKFTVAK